MERFGRSMGGAASSLSMTMLFLYCSRLSISAAAKAAAPPPTMTILPGSVAVRFPRWFRLWLGAPLPHENFVIGSLDGPARYWLQCRSAQNFASAQVKTGVVPWTSNGVANDEAFSQRAIIMRAKRAHGEYLGAAAHEQDVVLANMAEKYAVFKIGGRDAKSQVRAPWRCWLMCHLPLRLLGGQATRLRNVSPRRRVIAKATEHMAGDHIGVGLVHAAGRHAGCAALIITPTPCGLRVSEMALAICAVILS